MKKEMLINCLQQEEIRIAIIENGVLEELYVERASAEASHGISTRAESSTSAEHQAAFVDFGVGRNFLHVSTWARILQAHRATADGRARRRRSRRRADPHSITTTMTRQRGAVPAADIAAKPEPVVG